MMGDIVQRREVKNDFLFVKVVTLFFSFRRPSIESKTTKLWADAHNGN